MLAYKSITIPLCKLPRSNQHRYANMPSILPFINRAVHSVIPSEQKAPGLSRSQIAKAFPRKANGHCIGFLQPLPSHAVNARKKRQQSSWPHTRTGGILCVVMLAMVTFFQVSVPEMIFSDRRRMFLKRIRESVSVRAARFRVPRYHILILKHLLFKRADYEDYVLLAHLSSVQILGHFVPGL